MNTKSSKKNMELSGDLWLNRAKRGFLGRGRIELLEHIQNTGSLNQAARKMGMSYKTAWDSVRAMNQLTEKPLIELTTGGAGGGGSKLTAFGVESIRAFRLVEAEHKKYLDRINEVIGDADVYLDFFRRISMRTSARNQFAGKITKVAKGAVNAEVELTLNGGDKIVAIITNDSLKEMSLKKSDLAYALIKASFVILCDNANINVSTCNKLKGTLEDIKNGAVNSEVTVKLVGGNFLTAIITKGSVTRMGLKIGQDICALIKASHVILGK